MARLAFNLGDGYEKLAIDIQKWCVFMVFLSDLLSTVIWIYIHILAVRFLLQLFRADFYNPLAQSIVNLTQPLVTPLQKALPSLGRFSLSTLLIMVLMKLLIILVNYLLLPTVLPSVMGIMLLIVIQLLEAILNVIMVAVLGVAILSWVAPQSYHPGTMLLQQLASPILSRLSRSIPSIGGVDFSPMVVVLTIFFVKKYLFVYLVTLVYVIG